MIKNILFKTVAGLVLLSSASLKAQSTDLISLSDPASFGPLVSTVFTGTGSQGVSGWVVNGGITSGDLIFGDIASSQNWNSLYTQGISSFELVANISAPNNNIPFSLEFLDSSSGSIDVWSAVTGTSAFIGPINFGLTPSSPGSGNYSDVKQVILTWANSSPDTINATFSKVTVIPEPSTYALLALGASALGGYAMRRRRG